jgi:SAM-dependent methyltransferase
MGDQAQQLRADAELYDVRAANYGVDPDDLDHSIPPGLEAPYRADLEEALGALDRYKSVLEVGAGTGALTQLLAKWGCRRIVGTDISKGMLDVARAKLPKCEFKVVTAEVEPNLFRPECFDLIISRQVVCHLMDPIAVFECWKQWLKPRGRVAIIDGLWTRVDWGPPRSAAGALVDHRPLSCTQTWATLNYLLERSGLSVGQSRMLERVNAFAKERFAIGDPREPIFRYVVVAARGKHKGKQPAR